MAEAEAEISFQRLVEYVEDIKIEDLEVLGEIVNMHLIKQRREELIADKEETLEALRRGEVHRGTVDDLLRDLEEDLRD